MTSGNLTWTSGPPFSIYSGLGTFLREGFSGDNEAIALENMGQLDKQVTFRMSGNGPYIVPASAIGSDGRGVAAPGQAAFNGQIFYNPGPLQLGTLQKTISSMVRPFSIWMPRSRRLQRLPSISRRICIWRR